MALFGLLTRPDINVGVAEARQTPGALLLDVRTKAEYDAGHIAGSRSFPLDALQQAPQVLPDKSTPLFVYCLSGGRSSRAAATLCGSAKTALVVPAHSTCPSFSTIISLHRR